MLNSISSGIQVLSREIQVLSREIQELNKGNKEIKDQICQINRSLQQAAPVQAEPQQRSINTLDTLVNLS